MFCSVFKQFLDNEFILCKIKRRIFGIVHYHLSHLQLNENSRLLNFYNGNINTDKTGSITSIGILSFYFPFFFIERYAENFELDAWLEAKIIICKFRVLLLFIICFLSQQKETIIGQSYIFLCYKQHTLFTADDKPCTLTPEKK